MIHDWNVTKADFTAAATWVVTIAETIRPEQWSAPGLGSWDLRALLGHTSRALSTVETYLAAECDEPVERSGADYLAALPAADPVLIAQRGVAAGSALGVDPCTTFAELATRVVALVEQTDPSTRLPTALGVMQFDEYLPTRTFELIVHGLDLAVAIGADTVPPSAATEATARLIVEAALLQGKASALCEALTGRPSRHGAAAIC